MIITITVIIFIIFCIFMITYNIKDYFTVTTDHPNIEIVIARYNENTEWLNEEPFNKFKQVIYEKGPLHMKSKTNRIIKTLPNVGREGHSFLYHIIENYDNLSDIMIFLCGSAMDDRKKNSTNDVMSRLTKDQVIDRCNGTNDYMNEMKDFILDEYQSLNEKNKSINDESKLQKSKLRPYKKWLEHYAPNITKLPNIWWGGVFSVTKNQILKHPKELYIQLLSELSYHSNPETGHYLERTWAGLFC